MIVWTLTVGVKTWKLEALMSELGRMKVLVEPSPRARSIVLAVVERTLVRRPISIRPMALSA